MQQLFPSKQIDALCTPPTPLHNLESIVQSSKVQAPQDAELILHFLKSQTPPTETLSVLITTIQNSIAAESTIQGTLVQALLEVCE
jgi:hypothetical protein